MGYFDLAKLIERAHAEQYLPAFNPALHENEDDELRAEDHQTAADFIESRMEP